MKEEASFLLCWLLFLEKRKRKINKNKTLTERKERGGGVREGEKRRGGGGYEI
jgi:hypothetical protein